MPAANEDIHGDINRASAPGVSPIVPGDLNAVPLIIKELSSLGGAPDVSKIDDSQRLELISKTKSLLLALETPRETMIRHCWGQPAAFAALTTGAQKGVWSHLAEHEGPFKAADVAKEVSIDPSLLSRLFRHLGAMGYIKEVEADTYEGTSFSKSLGVPIFGNSYPLLGGHCLQAHHQFHEYSEKNGWKEPNDITNGPYQYVHKTTLNFFEYIQAFPQYAKNFNQHMAAYHQGRPSWMDPGFFPVKEKLIDGFDNQADSAMLVDIGGNRGHDIEEFYQKHPNVPGRLVLQDLPAVVESIEKLDVRIERMPYDFNNPQPVTGARAYFMHSVMHDWPDEICLNILKNVTAAMKPGYSKLLINENVVPNTGAHWEATGLDIMMMMLVSARERTREHWGELMSKAGLKIIKVWTARSGAESLIECELA